MDLPAGMGPEQIQERRNSLTTLREALYAGEAWFLYQKQDGPTVFGFEMLRSAKGFTYCNNQRVEIKSRLLVLAMH
jgi:hypothetical protein|eukprot:2650294-Prymnesium_polylepis.1